MRTALTVGFLAALALAFGAHAAAPPAGASIGNQASATYTDDSSVARSVTSNTVVTIVQQVASLTLTAPGTKSGNAGGQVAFPHTLTNTGNGKDTFALVPAQTGGSFNFTTVLLYADANGDGVPDSLTPITTTGELAAGGVFKFVAVGLAPITASAGNTNTFTVTATSVFTPAVTANNIDTTTITTQGVVNVTQSLDVIQGPSPAGPRTITLTYANTGNTTATNLVLTDLIPSGMTYRAGSARWSVTGSGTVLTDATDGAQGTSPTITYDFGQTLANRVTATISSVPVGASGTVTFQVDVNGSLPAGANAATRLTATYAYNDGSAPVAQANTNTVQYTVLQTGGVDVADAAAPIASAAQGATVSWTNAVQNTGSGADTINLTFGTQSFPAGTTFLLYRADGVTPVVDSNNDGLPDTGPLAAGASVNVVVKATLPIGVNGGGAYTVQLVGRSAFDTTKSDFGTDTLTTIGANSVDLVNATTPVTGTGAGPELTAATTNTVAPGGTVRFPLTITNNSSIADNFNLAASTDSLFANFTMPSGWTVVFHDANGAVITNTGVIGAGGSRAVFADVTAPANATVGFDIFFRALSPSSGIGDSLHDAVTVGTVRGLVLTPNNVGQAVSGGTIVYTHTIVNNGTSIEGDGASTVTLTTTSTAGFSSTIHWDQNNNGVLDASDPIVASLAALVGGTNGASPLGGLSAGEHATLFVKVTAAPGAANGATDTTTLIATTTGVIGGIAAPAVATATDTTAIVASNLTLTKLQAMDANCDGTIEGSWTSNSLGAGAVPGACIRYQITATNAGGANILSLLINDATPAETSYHATAPAASTVGTVTTPADGAMGSVQADVGTLAPGQTAVLTFGVRINQ